MWEPEEQRKRGRPYKTLKTVIEEDVELKDNDLKQVMLGREQWTSHIMSPPSGWINEMNRNIKWKTIFGKKK